MEGLHLHAVNCICVYLDVASIYCLLRCGKKLFEYWEDKEFWTGVLSRAGKRTIEVGVQSHFALEDCCKYKSILWSSSPFTSPLHMIKDLSKSLHRAIHIPLTAVSESSHEGSPRTSIENTVRNGIGFEFWCSSGSLDSDGEEFLCYRLERSAIVVWIGVQLPYLYDYPALQYRVRIGSEPDRWEYISEETTVADSKECYLVVLPALVVGSYLRVDLIGKRNSHEGKYFVTVSNVTCVGLPVHDYLKAVEIDYSAIAPEVSTDTAETLIHKLVSQPVFLTRKAFAELEAVGFALRYFEKLSWAGCKRSRLEVELIAQYFDLLICDFDTLNPRLLLCEEVGDYLESEGKLEKAKSCYSSCRCYRKEAKCLLLLGRFSECLALVERQRLQVMDELEILAAGVDMLADWRNACSALGFR